MIGTGYSAHWATCAASLGQAKIDKSFLAAFVPQNSEDNQLVTTTGYWLQYAPWQWWPRVWKPKLSGVSSGSAFVALPGLSVFPARYLLGAAGIGFRAAVGQLVPARPRLARRSVARRGAGCSLQ